MTFFRSEVRARHLWQRKIIERCHGNQIWQNPAKIIQKRRYFSCGLISFIIDAWFGCEIGFLLSTNSTRTFASVTNNGTLRWQPILWLKQLQHNQTHINDSDWSCKVQHQPFCLSLSSHPNHNLWAPCLDFLCATVQLKSREFQSFCHITLSLQTPRQTTESDRRQMTHHDTSLTLQYYWNF